MFLAPQLHSCRGAWADQGDSSEDIDENDDDDDDDDEWWLWFPTILIRAVMYCLLSVSAIVRYRVVLCASERTTRTNDAGSVVDKVVATGNVIWLCNFLAGPTHHCITA